VGEDVKNLFGGVLMNLEIFAIIIAAVLTGELIKTSVKPVLRLAKMAIKSAARRLAD